ncbi:MAG: hypothetical protein ACP5I1_11370 [Candidatus Hinthialibacter sp.]
MMNYAQHLTDLIEDLKVDFAIEKSFKISQHRINGDRFVIGIEKKSVTDAQISSIVDRLNMPEQHRAHFFHHAPDCNVMLFGYEKNENAPIFKAYLEFWDRVKLHVRRSPNKKEPQLMHLGYKWNYENNSQAAITRYTCHPLITTSEILDKMKQSYFYGDNARPLESIIEIVRFASTRIFSRYPFVFLDVEEENNPRRSFDVNLYKAHLPLEAVSANLHKITQSYFISDSQFHQVYDPIRPHLLGHIAGGVDREGREYASFYYETKHWLF